MRRKGAPMIPLIACNFCTASSSWQLHTMLTTSARKMRITPFPCCSGARRRTKGKWSWCRSLHSRRPWTPAMLSWTAAIVLKGWMVVSCRSFKCCWMSWSSRCTRPSWLMGLVDTIAMSVTACCLNNISSVVTFHTKGSTKRSWDHKKTLCLRLPSRGSKKAFTTCSNTLVDMRDRGLPRNSLYSSTRCLSFHVEWQVELRKDKEGLDTVGILLAEHHAHQSAWHHVEAQLSVLYVFWNKGVTCNFFCCGPISTRAQAADMASAWRSTEKCPRVWPDMVARVHGSVGKSNGRRQGCLLNAWVAIQWQ